MENMLGRRPRRKPTTENAYDGLRNMALAAWDKGLPQPPSEHPDVAGLVVDIPAQGGFATVVGLTDNTTSMYTSVGGGTIGAGEHAAVASATHRALAVVQEHLASFRHADDKQLPPTGVVRFHVLTISGARRADVPEDSFWERAPHDLMPVIAATQDLIAAIRQASPS
jgi:hypothetical protein